jgi:hypothetical protein
MISDISAKLDVLCPDHEATRHLTTFINQHVVDVGVVAIPLRLSKKAFENCRPPLESRVYARLSALRSADDLHQTYSLDLAHNGDRTLPYFSGALAIHASIADDCVGFFLAGQYRPTGDIIGTLSDLTLGRRIAQASVSNLLHTIATYVKNACAHNEAARAGKRSYGSPGAVVELMQQRSISRCASQPTYEDVGERSFAFNGGPS